MTIDFTPILLSLKLAAVTTIILLVVGIPLAFWLATSRRWIAGFIDPLVSMPLVLPPTVLGFYLLLILSPRSPLGHFLESIFDLRIVFTFSALIIGSIIFSLPFMVNPIKSGFQSIPVSLMESAYTLGKSRWQTLVKVLIPNNWPSILSGIIISFAHTLGEFGVVLMVGGSIPNETRLASIAIYAEVESLNYSTAHVYSLFLIAMAFTVLLSVSLLNRGKIRMFG